jgi:hypothetical protein
VCYSEEIAALEEDLQNGKEAGKLFRQGQFNVVCEAAW